MCCWTFEGRWKKKITTRLFTASVKTDSQTVPTIFSLQFFLHIFFVFLFFERRQDFNRLRAIKTRNILNSIFSSFWMYSMSVWRVSTIWYKCFSCFVYKYFQYPTLHHCALVAVPEYTHYLSLYVYRVIHGGM